MKLETIIIILVAAYIIYMQMKAYNKMADEIKLLRLASANCNKMTAAATAATAAATDAAPTADATKPVPPDATLPQPTPSSTSTQSNAAATPDTFIQDAMMGGLEFMMRFGGELGR